jgi:hypothetical protein
MKLTGLYLYSNREKYLLTFMPMNKSTQVNYSTPRPGCDEMIMENNGNDVAGEIIIYFFALIMCYWEISTNRKD